MGEFSNRDLLFDIQKSPELPRIKKMISIVDEYTEISPMK